MRLKRIFLALICTSTLVLAACSSDADEQNASDETSENGGDSENSENPDGLDDLGDLGDMGEMPDPEIDSLPDVIAEVNGTEITRDEFLPDYEAYFQQMAMAGQGQELDQDQIKRDIADMFVDQELIVQAADSEGIKPSDDDVEEFLLSLAGQNGAESVDQFLEMLEEQGSSADEVRTSAAKQVQIEDYIDSQADIDPPSDDELKEQYDEMLQQFEGQELDEEQIPDFDEMRDQLEDNAKNEQRSAAAQEIIDKLRDGADITVNL